MPRADRLACGAAVEYGRRLVLSVIDDGARVNGHTPPGSGRGLAGMRERTTLSGGSRETGPLAGGGFAVRARPARRDRVPALVLAYERGIVRPGDDA